MIYVVSGQPRTGTSMMMQCMEAGGLPAFFCPDREAIQKMRAKRAGGPLSNTAYYELSDGHYVQIFRKEIAQGMVVKIMAENLFLMPDDVERRVIFMSRDPDESHASMHAHFFGGNFKEYAEIAPYRNGRHIEKLAQINRELPACASVHEFAFDDVIASPLEAFTSLAEDGWPIDPVKAASIIDTGRVNFGRHARTERAA